MLTAQPSAWSATLAVVAGEVSDAARVVLIASTEALGATANHGCLFGRQRRASPPARSRWRWNWGRAITVNCICPGRSTPA